MRLLFLAVVVLALVFIGCSSHNNNVANNTSTTSSDQLPYLTFQKEQLFPGDSSLLRPEDGVALADGRLIVSDQAHGLRLIEKDGSNRAFGRFSDVGYVHHPPKIIAGANGVFLEHDAQHILMCDIENGKIYRVNLASEKVQLLHDHPYGVNAVYHDKQGAIWFSESNDNGEAEGPSADPDFRLPQGAVFRMTDLTSKPTLVVDSLYMANGITMDRDEKMLYVAETMMNRVLSFDVDVTNGNIKNADVAAIVIAPDNIMVDPKGRLIIASPGSNKVIAVDFKAHSQQVIFDASTPGTRKVANEWFLNSQAGLPRTRLIGSNMHHPLPGLLTGMFFSPDGRTLYIANLGRDLVKLDFQ